MTHHTKNNGLKRLIQKFENDFNTEENINYYSVEDFLKSRRKYLQYMLKGPNCNGFHSEENGF